METYVHGYSSEETRRLKDQANTLARLLLDDIVFPAGAKVLEPGCGIGAQTLLLASRNPGSFFTSFDISEYSIATARARIGNAGLSNVAIDRADVFELPYDSESFDNIFVCFLLEHLQTPERALSELMRVLRVGGAITIIEGDHGSYFCHPRSEDADRVVNLLIDVQARKGGNALIGRELYPLLVASGFRAPAVEPRMVYVDSGKPHLVDGFIEKTFIAMVKGVEEEAISLGLVDRKVWRKGVAALYETTKKDGVFCYTFFRGNAIK